MQEIRINLAEQYSIYIGEELLQAAALADFCRKQANTIVIIVDENIKDLYGEPLRNLLQKRNINAHLLTFAAGEENKTREAKQALEDQLFELGCGRDTCLIAMGGGITTDMVGFIAATYNRGIPVVYIPTSLLAMVDASIGGKTAVNTPYGKNLVGAFYQPKAVFIDTAVLKTLPAAEFKNGMVEIIKHALIKDAAYFDLLVGNITAIKQLDATILEQVITISCQIKKQIVEQDEHDYGIRQLLNFGHTIGHALEQVSNYKLSHGEAVALGMIAESYMSVQLGFLSSQAFANMQDILQQYNIPTKLQISYAEADIKKILILDKKAKNKQPYFVLLDDIGKAHVSTTGHTMPVTDDIITKGLGAIC